MNKMRLTMHMKTRLYEWLCSAKLLHFVMPALMIYLVVGTVAQKYIGLYEATKLFFASPIYWLGPVPLPGMPVFVALIALNLIFKVAFKSPWTKHNAGIIITHIGAIALLVGGLLTAMFSSEGYIALAEGETKGLVSDYHIREFVITDDAGNIYALQNHNDIHIGQIIAPQNVPFKIKILETCRNCAISLREEKSENMQGMAKQMQLSDAPLRQKNEENMAGMTFQIIHPDHQEIFVAIEDVPQIPRVSVQDKEYSFILRRQIRPLPFKIELIDFEKQSYKGTDMAKSYTSKVRIIDGDLQWDSVISMNAPLRYKGYTFFQSSFFATNSGEVSVLAVVWNVGRAFPYIAGFVMGFGLLLHMFVRYRMAAMIILALASVTIAPPAFAQDAPPPQKTKQALPIDDFAQIPILDQGRIKPIDSFARAYLKTFSGREGGATPWLIEVLLDPARSENRPVIKVANPDLLRVLNLEKRKNKLYSYGELSRALNVQQPLILKILEAKEEDWSPQHRELIILQQKTVQLRALLSSLSLFLPLAMDAPSNAPNTFNQSPITYYNTNDGHIELQNMMRAVVQENGTDFTAYSPEEQNLAQIAFTLSALEENGKAHKLFNVFPDSEKWHTPWQAIQDDEAKQALALWQGMALAYHAEDIKSWNENSKALRELSSGYTDVRGEAMHVEYLYNIYNPFYISALLCGVALLLLCTGVKYPKAYHAVILLIWSSIIIQLIGISTRVYILERPPVSTLYETVIFVCALTMLYGALAYRKNKATMWLWLSIGLGLTLHILGFSHDRDGDSFVMLSAVLNTNFWLTTHVLCITAGYAFCAVTSLLAHIIICKMVLQKKPRPDQALFANMHSAALLSLLFAAIGTVLGGVWADQSWGRFWGWDPKENGALLIVLWLVWVLHGRISGQMNLRKFTYGMAYLSVILALSWFGVNILSVGLHSYGFTDSMAISLGVFIALETAFIAGAGFLLNAQKKRIAANV